jgi:hypothetical protein
MVQGVLESHEQETVIKTADRSLMLQVVFGRAPIWLVIGMITGAMLIWLRGAQVLGRSSAEAT